MEKFIIFQHKAKFKLNSALLKFIIHCFCTEKHYFEKDDYPVDK